MQRWSVLETGHCVCLEVFSIFRPFVLVKNNTAKGKEAFQGKFVVIVVRFARKLFLGQPLFLPVHSRLQL